MKKTMLTGFMALALFACKNEAKETDEAPKNEVAFNTLLDEYYEDGLKLNPLGATMTGDNRYKE